MNSTTYEPELEAARDRQRALEREVRSLKRELAVTLEPDDIAGVKKDIRDTQAEIRAHIQAHGLPRKAYREQLHFADGK